MVPERRDDRDKHGYRANQQGRLGDAGPADPRVLQNDGSAVPGRSRHQHERAARGAHRGAGGGDEKQRGGQAKPREGEPARRQPLQGQLGQRHGRAPQQPGRGECCESAATIGVHEPIVTMASTEFAC
jgi:hypothetical protein